MGTLYALVLPLRFLGDVWRLPALLRMPLAWWLVRLRRQRKGTSTPSAMSSCIAYRQKQKGGSFSKCAYIATPGTRFGPNLICSLYNVDNPMSFAAAVVDYELAFPLRGSERRSAHLFTPDGRKRWTASQIDSTLAAVMANTLTPAQRVGKTFHSKRVWVATGFTDLASSEGETQAMARWATPESLRIYARMNLDYQAKRRDMLQHAHVNALNATRRPTVDENPDELHELSALADALDDNSE